MSALIITKSVAIVEFRETHLDDWIELDARRWDSIPETEWFIGRMRQIFPENEWRVRMVERQDISESVIGL